MNSKGCESVWQAIEKRRTHKGIAARNLFEAVDRALRFDELAQLTQSEKQFRAANLQQALELLCLGIEELNLCPSWPDAVSNDVREELSHHFARAITGQLGWLEQPAGVAMGEVWAGRLTIEDMIKDRAECSAETMERARERSQRAAAAIEEVLRFRMIELITPMKRLIQDWADKPQIVSRPKKEHARRTYFLRSISDHFMTNYGTPLHAQTLAIGSVFFDCSKMSVSEIKRIGGIKGVRRT